VQELQDEKLISIRPNPAKEQFIVRVEQQGYFIKSAWLISSLGKPQQIVTNLSASQLRIDRNQLPGGMYFLYLELSDGTIIVRKVMWE
jgi:hypothetical protein